MGVSVDLNKKVNNMYLPFLPECWSLFNYLEQNTATTEISYLPKIYKYLACWNSCETGGYICSYSVACQHASLTARRLCKAVLHN